MSKRNRLARTIVPMSEDDKNKKTEQQIVMEQAVRQLEKLGGSTFREDDITFKGKQIVLPESMTIEQGIAFLEDKAEELTVVTAFQRTFKYRPWDVAFCAWNVLRETFGAVSHKDRTVQTMFGPMKAPPQLIDIAVGPSETIAVPWGNFILPHLPEVTFSLNKTMDDDYGLVGYMAAEGPKRWRYAVQGVFELIERELKTNSLYRGRAFDGRETPQFLDLSKVDAGKMVYSQEVTTQMDAFLWGALRFRETLKEEGVPFKRAVLLSGSFGVGKSMAINRTGQIAQEEEVTFILVRPGRDNLRDALVTAKMYEPAVVAFEDVDVIAHTGNDSGQVSEILDLFDGIEAKNSEIMLVLTTNHVEKLHKGMMRPGRLDAIIEIGPPDAAGIQKLIEVNLGAKLADDIEWLQVSEAMEDYLPAFVVEASQRAIRYATVRSAGRINGTKLTTGDLVAAGEGLRPQYDLMQDAIESKAKNSLDEALGEIVKGAVQRVTDKTAVQVEEIHSNVV